MGGRNWSQFNGNLLQPEGIKRMRGTCENYYEELLGIGWELTETGEARGRIARDLEGTGTQLAGTGRNQRELRGIGGTKRGAAAEGNCTGTGAQLGRNARKNCRGTGWGTCGNCGGQLRELAWGFKGTKKGQR